MVPNQLGDNFQPKDEYIVSATTPIIKTHLAAKRCQKYSERIIKKTTIRVHYTMETMSKLTVTSMNFPKTGFH